MSPVVRISTPSAKACLKALKARVPGLPAMGSSSMPAIRPMLRKSITCGKPFSECTASLQYACMFFAWPRMSCSSNTCRVASEAAQASGWPEYV